MMFEAMFIVIEVIMWAGVLGIFALSLWGSWSLWQSRTRLKATQGAFAVSLLQGGMALINAVMLAVIGFALYVQIAFGTRWFLYLLAPLVNS